MEVPKEFEITEIEHLVYDFIVQRVSVKSDLVIEKFGADGLIALSELENKGLVHRTSGIREGGDEEYVPKTHSELKRYSEELKGKRF